MKELAKITVNQRTAVGHHADAETRVKLYKGIYENVVFENQGECVGYVTIEHPAIMAGTTEEIENDFAHLALNAISEKGLTVTNKWEVIFWK